MLQYLWTTAFKYVYPAWIGVRVLLITAIWLAVILGTFVGYLTIPIVVITVFLLVYTLNDVKGQLFRRPDRKRRGG